MENNTALAKTNSGQLSQDEVDKLERANTALTTNEKRELGFVSNNQISVYGMQVRLSETIKKKAKFLIKQVYNNLIEGWFNTLFILAEDEKWSDEKMLEAVLHFLRTHEYKDPMPAHVLKFDKKIEMLSHNEYLAKLHTMPSAAKYYAIVDIAGKPHYTPKENVEKYHLKKFVPYNQLKKPVIYQDTTPATVKENQINTTLDEK